MGRFWDRIFGRTAKAQYEKDAAQDAAIAAIVTVGTAAPSTKPSAKNLIYFASTAQKLYVSTGTTASTDWKEVKAVDPA